MQIVAVAAGATALVGAVAFVLGRKKGSGAPPAAAPRPGAPAPVPQQRPPEPSAPRAAAPPEDVERARLEAQRIHYEAESAAMQLRQ